MKFNNDVFVKLTRLRVSWLVSFVNDMTKCQTTRKNLSLELPSPDWPLRNFLEL